MKVVCEAITDFYVVFFENLVVPVIFRKMFIDEVQKLSVAVCLKVHAVGPFQNKPISGLLSTLMSSPADFNSFSLSGRLRAVGLGLRRH